MGSDFYPTSTHLRAVLLSSVSSLSAPTLAEIAAGDEISQYLPVNGGWTGSYVTVTESQSRWSDDLDQEVPVRYALSNAALVGYRRIQGGSELLWDAAATFRSRAVLLVRRGILATDPWQAGDQVEAVAFRWGRRANLPPSQVAMFRAPVFAYQVDDEATVAA